LKEEMMEVTVRREMKETGAMEEAVTGFDIKQP